MQDQEFIERFERGEFSHDQWHHREHIKIAYLYLTRLPFDEALARVREGIQRLNSAQKVPDALDRGYHETMTHAWMVLVQCALAEYGRCDTADLFFEANPQLSQKKVLRLFYSRERLMSAGAKRQFVEPDLTSLPRSSKGLNPAGGGAGPGRS